MTASLAAEAMAAGIRRAVPDAVIDLCPIADGGEGMLSAFTTALPGQIHQVIVDGPLGDPVETAFGSFAQGMFAVVESAMAAGLQLIPEQNRDPEKTSSYGVGELLVATCRTAPRRIIVGVGGSATNDGGCGMAQALGVRFFDHDDRLIEQPVCGGMLNDIKRIDASGQLAALANIEIIVASDVRNPLTGPQGAAAVYGPQKGATAEQVARLDSGLANLAGLIHRDLDMDIEMQPGSGAAGGLGGGLVAFAGATITSGIDAVLEAANFDRRVQGADLCLTGEGKIDSQSVSGKACIGVARAAGRYGVPTIALVGAVGSGAEHCLQAGLEEIVVIGEGLPAEQSIQQAEELIAAAAGEVARKHLDLSEIE